MGPADTVVVAAFARPTANDAMGRLRGLWVSSVGAAGDILTLMYTWQAERDDIRTGAR